MHDKSVAGACRGNGGLDANVGGGPVGIWAYDSTRILIERNTSFDNFSQPRGNGIDGDGFDLDGGTSNSVMQFNYSRHNQGAGYLLTQFSGARRFENNLIRFNISEDDATGIGSYVSDGDIIESTVFDNNTVYASGNAAAVQILPYGRYAGLAFRNNIFSRYGNGRMFDSHITDGIAVQGNFYWAYDGAGLNVSWGGQDYATLADWRAGAGVEQVHGRATGQQTDPGLVAAGHGGVIADPRRLDRLDAYRLVAGARAQAAGLDVQRLFGTPEGTLDFFSRRIPATMPPVGAVAAKLNDVK